MSVNKAILIGRLGHPPSLQETNGGTQICKFSVATEHSQKVDGDWQKATTWHNVVCFGKTAESCKKYLDKGSLAYIEGRIENDTYEKDGIKRHVSRVIADQVRFLGGRQNYDSEGRPDNPTYSGNPQGVSFEDDDIPF